VDTNLPIKHSVNFSLTYTHNWVKHPLYFEILVNDHSVNLDVSGHHNIELNKKIILTKHNSIKFKLFNKDHDNTVVNDAGQIVEDSFITLQKLVIDGINLTQILKRSSTIGLYKNTTTEFEFDMPIEQWLLEKLF